MFSKSLHLILSPASKINSPAASSEADTCWEWNVNSLNAVVVRNQKEHEVHVLVYEKQGESSSNTFVVTAFKTASSSFILVANSVVSTLLWDFIFLFRCKIWKWVESPNQETLNSTFPCVWAPCRSRLQAACQTFSEEGEVTFNNVLRLTWNV